MPVRPDFDPAHLYFITTTAVERAHLFRRDIVKRILVDSLDFIRVLGRVNLYAFVVMPNHVHFIVRFLVEYIHNNPCQPHWTLAQSPEDYAWSSARYYLLGEPAIIFVVDAREWLA